MRQVKSLVSMSGLLTKGNIYTVHHENKGFLTIYDDRGVSCVYSESRFEPVLAPQVAPNFSQMQQIADEVKNTLQPDESGIKCPVVEEYEARKKPEPYCPCCQCSSCSEKHETDRSEQT